MFDKVAKIISEHQGIDINDIALDSYIVSDLGLNSFDIVDLVCRFENEFGIEISDRKIKQFQQVSDVVAYLEKSV